MGDMLMMIEFNEPTWKLGVNDALQSVAWAIRSTISIMSRYTPGQLIFSKDMIMEKIKTKRLAAAEVANQRKNKFKLKHTYRIGDKVLLTLSDEVMSKLDAPTDGPYQIVKAFHNGTIRINRGAFNEVLHIRNMKPFHE